jgi:hypothetical protein
MNSEKKEIETEKKRKNIFESKFFKTKLFKVLLVGIIAIILIVLIGLNLKNYILNQGQTTRIGFEDIGELASQSYTLTEVESTEKARELFGVKVPFTESKIIYSYDVIIKAGYDFDKIKWEEKGKTILVYLPQAKVLSKELDLDSFKVYHEDESIFRPIKLVEENDAKEQMIKRAEKDAIDKGLFKAAEENAKKIIKSFLMKKPDYKNYDIKFK